MECWRNGAPRGRTRVCVPCGGGWACLHHPTTTTADARSQEPPNKRHLRHTLLVCIQARENALRRVAARASVRDWSRRQVGVLGKGHSGHQPFLGLRGVRGPPDRVGLPAREELGEFRGGPRTQKTPHGEKRRKKAAGARAGNTGRHRDRPGRDGHSRNG